MFSAGFNIKVFDCAENICRIFLILWIIGVNLDTEELRAFDKAVNTNGEILTVEVNKASIEDGQKSRVLIIPDDGIESGEVFMNIAHNIRDIFRKSYAILRHKGH